MNAHVDVSKLAPEVQALIAGLQAKVAAAPVRSISFKITAKKPDGSGHRWRDLGLWPWPLPCHALCRAMGTA